MTLFHTETNTATVDTPEGTIVRLVKADYLAAEAGALAIVEGRSPMFRDMIRVKWLKGHQTGSTPQLDGGYYPDAFEICEFQVGDRVRVTADLFEKGDIGKIVAIPALNGDDCVVAVDGKTWNLSYHFKNLEQYSEGEEALDRLREKLSVVEDDEPEDEPQPVPAFQAGDIVVIDRSDALTGWVGLRFVVQLFGYANTRLTNGSIDKRPDGFQGDFYWPTEKLRPFDPSRDFKVGDIVDAPRYTSLGVVTATEGVTGGDIEVDWTEGNPGLVAYGAIGASRKYLTVVGVQREPEPEVVEYVPLAVGDRVKVIDDAGHKGYASMGTLGEVTEVDHWGSQPLLTVLQDDGIYVQMFDYRFERSDDPKPAPEPIKSDFGFEAGQEIGSSDVLRDLPMGTVVILNGNEASPSIKLEGKKFGRLNRYGVKVQGSADRFLGYDETKRVEKGADDDEQTLMIAFVPSESR